MALDAVVDIKRILALAVAGAAGFAGSHIVHGGFADNSLVGEDLGVAVLAGVGSCMDVMAEGGFGNVFELEHYILGLHALVALGAVTTGGEDVLAVVAGAA